MNAAIEAGMGRQIQAFRAAIAEGMPRLGWKVGINDPAAQARLGLDGILVGWLDGRRVAEAGGTFTPTAGAIPRLEAETAIWVARDVPAGISGEAAAGMIEAIAPAFEFVDGAKPMQPLEELVAQDILHDGVMFGSRAPVDAATGLVAAGFPEVRQNGDVARRGLPGRYPDNLGQILAAVADTLEAYGERLLAGDVIIGGSYIDPFGLAPGDTLEADFGPLGKLRATIA